MLTLANVLLRNLLKGVSLLDSIDGAFLKKCPRTLLSLFRLGFTDLMLICVDEMGGDLDSLL
jgi:hypothetical protein